MVQFDFGKPQSAHCQKEITQDREIILCPHGGKGGIINRSISSKWVAFSLGRRWKEFKQFFQVVNGMIRDEGHILWEAGMGF